MAPEACEFGDAACGMTLLCGGGGGHDKGVESNACALKTFGLDMNDLASQTSE